MTGRTRRQQRGFTLIEVVVAFTIMAIALAALFQAFSTGVRGSRAVEIRGQLLARAEARLAMVGTAIPLAPGRHEGEVAATPVGGGTWRVTIRPDPNADTRLAESRRPGLRLYNVTVQVRAPDGATETLTTLRLGPAP
mgnify:CR=1 FL=1